VATGDCGAGLDLLPKKNLYQVSPANDNGQTIMAHPKAFTDRRERNLDDKEQACGAQKLSEVSMRPISVACCDAIMIIGPHRHRPAYPSQILGRTITYIANALAVQGATDRVGRALALRPNMIQQIFSSDFSVFCINFSLTSISDKCAIHLNVILL